MDELISVIVPVYNVRDYVDGCVRSIAAQSYSNLEIILVDDGSADGSGAICDSWIGKDSRIRVIHKENGGLSDARNAGIEVAKGKWFVFIDSDDTISPDNIRTMYDAATQNSCEIAVCNMVRIYDDGETEPFYAPVTEETVLYGNDRFETLKQPSACNKLFRADLFRTVRFPKGKFYEDTFVYHKLAYQARNIVLTGADGYYYLCRRGSILGTPKYTDRYFDMVESVFERVKDLVAWQVPDYAQEACLSLYAATAECEKFVPKTEQNREKVLQMRRNFCTAYEHLMKRSDVSVKQKLRLILLRYLPRLHSRLY